MKKGKRKLGKKRQKKEKGGGEERKIKKGKNYEKI